LLSSLRLTFRFAIALLGLAALCSTRTARAQQTLAKRSAAKRGVARPNTRWSTFESAKFRLHFRSGELVPDEVARVCEATRTAVRRTWLGVEVDSDWSAKCDVFLYADPAEFSRDARCPPEARGNASLDIGGGRVWKRRLDLRVDQPGYLESVLPHELTHVVLADRFCNQQIPRWADEGIAIQMESAGRRQEQWRLVADVRRAGRLLPLGEVLAARTYPADRRRAELFYAQGASFIEYLLSRMPAADVVRLIESMQRRGIEPALRDALGVATIAAIDHNWSDWLATQTNLRPTFTDLLPTQFVFALAPAASAASFVLPILLLVPDIASLPPK
jgi:hypothetical protein